MFEHFSFENRRKNGLGSQTGELRWIAKVALNREGLLPLLGRHLSRIQVLGQPNHMHTGWAISAPKREQLITVSLSSVPSTLCMTSRLDCNPGIGDFFFFFLIANKGSEAGSSTHPSLHKVAKGRVRAEIQTEVRVKHWVLRGFLIAHLPGEETGDLPSGYLETQGRENWCRRARGVCCERS